MTSKILPGVIETLRRAQNNWACFWFSEISARPYSIFRVIHGLTLFLFLATWWQQAPEWIGPNGFHFADEPAKPLPFAVLPFFSILQFGTLIFFIVGWRVRLTAAISLILLCYVTLIDRIAAFSINSIYLFTLTVFIIYPGKPTKRGTTTATPTRMLQLALVTIYFSSGWHKAVFGDWLDSPTVLRTMLSGIYMTDTAAWALHTFPDWMWMSAQYLTLAFELFSPVLFFSSSHKLRWFGIAFGCLFHLGIALFMDQLIYFSLQTMSFYILFLDEKLFIFGGNGGPSPSNFNQP